VLAAKAVRANVSRLDFPMKLTFCITYWCNYKCQTCNIWKMKPTNEMSIDEIRSFFEKSNRFSWIDVTGGEISLRKDFVDICDTITSNCKDLLLLHYPTNGYLTDQVVAYSKEVAKMSHERLMITISCDGDEAMNDKIRGIEGGYKRQLETFRQLREIPDVQVVLGMTLSASNVDHFPQAFAAAQKEVPGLTIEDFHVNIIHEGAYLHNDDLELRDRVDNTKLADATEAVAKLRGTSLHPVNVLEREYLKRVRKYLETGKTPMRCHAMRSSCFIDSWGNVFPCTIYDKKIGSLRDVDYDLEKIWNSDEAARVQQEIWEYKCPQCWTPCEAYQSIMGNFLRPVKS
jgi:MoaA/NifB/PqqE/SkfB family radical SAM enzyme